MSRAIAILKFSAAFGVVFGSLFTFYLGEWGDDPRDIEAICVEKHIALPLEDCVIAIDVQKKTLSLMNGDITIKRYDVGIGRTQQAGIIWSNVASTPLGEYRVVERRDDPNLFEHGTRFLRFDFPNLDDLDQAWRMEKLTDEEYDACMAAKNAGRPIPEVSCLRSQIGIEGNYFPFRGFHVTSDGSIAMRNVDLNELFEFVPLGARVVISH